MLNRSAFPARTNHGHIGSQPVGLALSGVVLILCLQFSAPDNALAGEPAWWTAQKQQCGLPATLVYSQWDQVCNAPSVAAPASGGGLTSMQQMQLNLANQAGTAVGQALGQALGNALFGNPQQDAANRAAAEAQARAQAAAAAQAASEQQRRAAELDRKAEEIKSQLLGGPGATGSLSLMGVQSTPQLTLMGENDTAELQPMAGKNQSQFFGSKAAHCPPSQDASVVDLCGRGDTVDPATIKMNSSAASIGGAGLSTGPADATIHVPQGQTTIASVAPSSSANPPSNLKPAPRAGESSDVTLAKLVPLLRPISPAGGSPIATSGRPAICESLSSELNQVQQLARRAILELDIEDRYNPKAKAVSPVMAAFDRISDNRTDPQRKVMQLLLPGTDDKAMRNLFAPHNSDYRAALYQDRTDPSKIILVFRGTKTLADWLKGNIPQGMGLGSTYYSNAIGLTRTLKQSATTQRFNLELVGYSMGGGMADAAGATDQVYVTTFNPSGVHEDSLPLSTDMSAAQRYLTDVVVDGDPLNMHQDHPLLTRAQIYTDSVLGGPLTPMALASGAATDIVSGGNAKQSLQELAALYSSSLPPAIGRRITLAPDPSDVNASDPLTLHYLSSVVNALVARSRALYGQYTFNGCGQ